MQKAPSFPRKREATFFHRFAATWIPAVAGMTLWAFPAHAFNTFQLYDPAFQRFVLLWVPIGSMLAMGLLDGLALLLLKPTVSPVRLIGRMMVANLKAILMSIALLALLLFYVTGVMTETEYALPILFGVGYFALALAGIAWWRKGRELPALGLPLRPAKRMLVLTTALGYGALYYVLYLRMFDNLG